jgi:hypothetical protein
MVSPHLDPTTATGSSESANILTLSLELVQVP